MYTCTRTEVEKSMDALKLSTRSLTRSMCPATTASWTEFIPSCKSKYACVQNRKTCFKSKILTSLLLIWNGSICTDSTTNRPQQCFSQYDGRQSIRTSFSHFHILCESTSPVQGIGTPLRSSTIIIFITTSVILILCAWNNSCQVLHGASYIAQRLYQTIYVQNY